MNTLVVGLGNPGRKYAKSKHNIGFMCLDAFAEAHKIKFRKETKFLGEMACYGQTILLKPKTFMNLSGHSVRQVAAYYGIESKDILIISDDIDLPFAKIRLREKGGSGGHNGLKSIIEAMDDQFKRLRIGIGRDEDLDPAKQVLSPLSKSEMKLIQDTLITATAVIEAFVSKKAFPEIMNQFNQ
ncbi:MAG: aminoacyl-tRNA hydrolase [Candidatus Izemoplasmatales bacterium]|jgi:PTH1 family peptidyl-tRNA hydrolase